jgi:Kef-type K+ transport system membrane component KefB
MMAGALVADTLSLVIFAGIIGSVDPSQPGGLPGLIWVAAKVVLFFGGAWTLGRFVFPRIGALVQRLGDEVSFTALLIVTLVFAEAAHLAGLHAVLGAFLAGLFLREKAVGRTLTQNTITWVRRAALGFLAPVFFVTAGSRWAWT